MINHWYDAAAAGLLALAVLAILFGMMCLFLMRGKLRVCMAIAVGGFFGTFLLWFGGGQLLEALGLAWRDPMEWTFALLLGLFGVCGLICDVRCLWELLRGHLAVQVMSTLLASLASIALALFLGLYGAFFMAFSGGDTRVVTLEDGSRAVERLEGFTSPYYAYYEYHGPFVRGREELFQRESRIDDG